MSAVPPEGLLPLSLYLCGPPSRFNVQALPEPGHRRIFSRVFSVRLVVVAPVSRIGFTTHSLRCPVVNDDAHQVPTDDFLASGRWIEGRAGSAGAFGDIQDGVVLQVF